MIEKVKLDAEKCIMFSMVQSSNIYAIGVHGRDLIIWFGGGIGYRYPDSSNMFLPLQEAESKGKFFHRKIKNIPNWNKICEVGGCLKKISGPKSTTCIDHPFPTND